MENKFHEKSVTKADALLSVSQFTADKTNEVLKFKQKFTIIQLMISFFKGYDSRITQYDFVFWKFNSERIVRLPFDFNEIK
jgi:hypothetical protein